MRTNLAASRNGIGGLLGTARQALAETTTALQATQSSLTVLQQGLTIAQDGQRVAHVVEHDTDSTLAVTTQTLATVNSVLVTLQPLANLTGQLNAVVAATQTGVTLARTTLAVGKQALVQVEELNAKTGPPPPTALASPVPTLP